MAVEDRDCFGTGVPRNDRGKGLPAMTGTNVIVTGKQQFPRAQHRSEQAQDMPKWILICRFESVWGKADLASIAASSTSGAELVQVSFFLVARPSSPVISSSDSS